MLTSSVVLGGAAIVGWGRFVTHVGSVHPKFGPFVIIMVRAAARCVLTALLLDVPCRSDAKLS